VEASRTDKKATGQLQTLAASLETDAGTAKTPDAQRMHALSAIFKTNATARK
jgi:hypothetical protein